MLYKNSPFYTNLVRLITVLKSYIFRHCSLDAVKLFVYFKEFPRLRLISNQLNIGIHTHICLKKSLAQWLHTFRLKTKRFPVSNPEPRDETLGNFVHSALLQVIHLGGLLNTWP